MNYEPNTTRWPVGVLVIHDADAKTDEMLMEVIGYTKDGMVKTRYYDPPLRMPGAHRFKVWTNELKYLHDPKRFGLNRSGKVATGKPISGRCVRVGDVVMNEWNCKRMKVIRVWDERRQLSCGWRRYINIKGVYDDGRTEVMSGPYWRARTRLVERP